MYHIRLLLRRAGAVPCDGVLSGAVRCGACGTVGRVGGLAGGAGWWGGLVGRADKGRGEQVRGEECSGPYTLVY